MFAWIVCHFGQQCSAGIRESFPGLCALQHKFGQVGVKIMNGSKYIFMVSAETNKPIQLQSIPLSENEVYLKIECNFREKQILPDSFIA